MTCGRNLDVDELSAIEDRAAEFLDAFGYMLHNVGQDIAADMRLSIPEDFSWRAGLDQGLEDETMGGVFGARIEFAVRKGPGPAESELDIAFGVECAGV